MECREATNKDLDDVLTLHSKYHVGTIRNEDRNDGFVTTLFTRNQLQELIDTEQGLFLLLAGQTIIGYAMSGSWNYWKAWPMFQHMIDGLHSRHFLGRTLNISNSYQYGPICIEKEYRGSGALEILFDFARERMSSRFPVLITFVNKSNPRSVAAHIRKLGLETILEFDYNGNTYLEMAYDTSRETGLPK